MLSSGFAMEEYACYNFSMFYEIGQATLKMMWASTLFTWILQKR